MMFALALVLEIALRLAARRLVERRLRNEEMAAFDQLGHLTVEEGEQQRADMSAVDIGVGHDDDLVVTEFVGIELLAPNAGAERRDQGGDLNRRQHLVETRPFDVQDLSAQRKDRLIGAVAPLLGGTTGAVALDQEEL